MKMQNIAVALVCVVFFTCARGAIAQTMEEKIALFPPEWFLPEGYFPEEWGPGGNSYEPWQYWPTPPYWLTDEGRAELGLPPLPNGPAAEVPEPGSLVLLIGGGLCLLGWAWRRGRRR